MHCGIPTVHSAYMHVAYVFGSCCISHGLPHSTYKHGMMAVVRHRLAYSCSQSAAIIDDVHAHPHLGNNS